MTQMNSQIMAAKIEREFGLNVLVWRHMLELLVEGLGQF